jgi:hypothetical protein
VVASAQTKLAATPGPPGRLAGDGQGVGVQVQADGATTRAHRPGQLDRDLPVAAADVQARPTRPQPRAGEERAGRLRHDRGLAGQAVGIGLPPQMV